MMATFKIFGVFSIVCLTLAAGGNHRSFGRVNDANQFQCPSEGFHPDPNDCRIFYRCVDWNSNVFFRDYNEPSLTPFQFTCGEGTVFDPEFNICNHPDQTSRKECAGRGESGGEMPNNEYPFTYPSSMLPGGENYPTEGGYPGYPMQEIITNYPESYPNEYENQISPDGEMMMESAPGECSGEGFFPVPGDCNRFIRCTDNGMGGYRKFVFRCGEGTVWDQQNLVCNHPGTVPGCGGSQAGGGNGQYPDQEGYPEDGNPQGGYPGENQQGNQPDQTGYPDTQGNQGGYPETEIRPPPENQGYPGQQQGNRPNQSGYPSQGPQNQGGYPTSGNQPSGQNQGYPQQQQGNRPPTNPQNQGSRPDQSGYPQQGGYPNQQNQGGYPTSGNQPPGQNQGYPQQQQGGRPPINQQNPGNRPDQSGYPQQGGYPTSGNEPSGQNQGYIQQQQGNRPPTNQQNQGNKPDQSGYPQQGGYPTPVNRPPPQNQGSRPPTNQQNQGNRPDQSGNPQQGGYPGQQNQGGYPTPGNLPPPQNQGHPQQGSTPPTNQQIQGNRPNQPGYPSQQGYPGQQNQGGYPTYGNQPPGQNQGYPQQPQGGRPPTNQQNQGNRPDQFGYPQQGGYPGQNGPQNRPGNQGYGPQPGYPQQGNQPGQSGYPQQGGYPNGPGESYPQQGQPSQGYPFGGSPGDNPNQPPKGNPNECQGDGFFSVPGDCMKFYRCVDNGKGGYMRYDFTCGPGTVWDQQLTTCNHPWAVQRNDCSTNMPGSSNMNSGSSPDKQQSGSGQSPTQSTTTTPNQQYPSNQNQMTTQPTPSQQSPSSQNEMSTQPTSTTSSHETTQRPDGQTTQAGTQSTTEGSQDGSTTPSNQSATPPGSRPCQPDKNQPVKCETAGYYPVPGNCKKFYRCADWDGDKGERFSVYFFECGEGTIWDPALQTCNHEESVYPPRDCSSGQSNQTSPAPTTTSQMTTEKTTTESTESTTPDETDTTPQEESTNSRPAESTPQSTESMTTMQMTTERQETTSELTDKPTEPDNSSPTEPDNRNPTEPNTNNPTETITSNPTEPGDNNPTEPTTDEDNNQTNQPDGSETNPDCPALENGQVAFVCPTGFRRHPKDCNLFYQCTISKEGDVNVMTFTCKNESVYDERKIQCLPPEETDPCPSQQNSRRRYIRRVEPEMTSVVPIASSESLCPREGHFPYDGDCQMFFKCKKDDRERMQGYLYQCQPKHTFSPASGRCERSSTVPKCGRSPQYLTPTNLKWMTSKVPIEYFDVR